MLHLNRERLKTLLGERVTYRGLACQIIDILEDELALVLHDLADQRILQANQYGDAGEHQPRTMTVKLLNVRGDRLNPEVPELAAFNLVASQQISSH